MDEELLKRFTDCVYFLASPLTCKKGLDCEYRHCEIARLNPRDCWYWLAGSCLNPTCAFRHPPLDGLSATATSESVPSTEPVNKTNVPCYFYFNGYCNKGDKCSFLHSIEADGPPVGSSVKPTVANSEVPQLESNTFAGSDSGLAPTNEHLNPSATVKAAVDAKVQPKEDFQDSELKDVQHQSDSPQISVSESEETTTVRSDSLLPARGSVQTASYESEEHSSGEQVEDQIDSEERWESSPGFDVLVDGEYGNFDCDDDQEYILALDRGRNELKSHLLGYEVENPAEYDSKYHDMELHYESEMYYPYDRQVTEDIFDDMRNIPGHRNAKMLDSILCHKRKLTPLELGFDNHRDVDLRDQLQRRRFIDSHSVTGLSRKQESNRLIDRSQDGPWRHGMGRRQLHGRLISEMGRNTLESLSNDQNYVNGGRSRGFLRHTQKYWPRKHFKEKRTAKRRFNSSEAPKKMASRERSAQSSCTFSRPKTLAQIREEKRKAENGDCTGEMRHSRTRRTTSTDFQGPRPLSEILKDKRKHTCESEAHTSSI